MEKNTFKIQMKKKNRIHLQMQMTNEYFRLFWRKVAPFAEAIIDTSITDNDWIRYFVTRAGRERVYSTWLSMKQVKFTTLSSLSSRGLIMIIRRWLLSLRLALGRRHASLPIYSRRAPRSSPRGGSNEFSGAIIRGLIRRDECARAPF